MTVDFGTGGITGDFNGEFFDETEAGFEEEGVATLFTSTPTGQLQGNQLAMTSAVDAEAVTGSMALLGGVFDNGSLIAGGASATLNNIDMGGRFEAGFTPD